MRRVGPPAGAFAQHEAEIAAGLQAWFADHPFEINWSRDYDFAVADPLGISVEALVADPEAPRLVEWAQLLRSFEVVTNEVVFHHGCGVDDVIALLEQPNAPTSIEALPLPYLIVDERAQVDRLIDLLCRSPQFEGLRHLDIGRAQLMLEGRHIEQLAGAPWARTLETLGLSEATIDWSTDGRDAEYHGALRALANFQSLTHLVMINNFGRSSDLAVFLEAQFPALTHLHLGAAPTDPELCRLLATTTALSELEELCLGGGPPRTDPSWDLVLDAPFPVFLHGRQVTTDYPKRGD